MTAGPVVTMRGICKSFSGVSVLREASFGLDAGEIHALLGGNGAGKTTLMNILYGLYRRDAGTVEIDGRPAAIRAPRDAIGHGIGMVHQHLAQVGPFSVLENVVLGTTVPRPWALDLAREARTVEATASRFGLELPLDARIDRLATGERQKAEILRALHRGARVLVLDEPTTNLTPRESAQLFAALRKLVEAGLSIVLITHKLREISSVADRITVLREGRSVLSVARAEISEGPLVEAMVGPGHAALHQPAAAGSSGDAAPAPACRAGEPPSILLDDVTVREGDGPARLTKVTLKVGCPEIVGVAGVSGNGQRELAGVILGLVRPRSGRVEVDGRDATTAGTAALLDHGLSYVPDDRMTDGLLPSATVAENYVLGRHRSMAERRGPVIDWKAVRAAASEAVTRHGVRCTGPDQPAGGLSGGNVQKLILARALAGPCRTLVAHNPTRGLDLVSTAAVHRDLRLLGRRAGILLISEDLDELLELASRIVVLFGGHVAGEFARGGFDEGAIGRLMNGVE